MKSGRDFDRNDHDVLMGMCRRGVLFGMRASGAARFGAGAESLVHDLLDGSRATSALGAATQASIDLVRRARHLLGSAHGVAHVVVGKHVAGTNDHGTD